jgi:hypothetical protein
MVSPTQVPRPDVQAVLSVSAERLLQDTRALDVTRALNRADQVAELAYNLDLNNKALEARIVQLQDQVALLQTLTSSQDPQALEASIDALRGKLAAEARAETQKTKTLLVSAQHQVASLMDRNAALETQSKAKDEEIARLHLDLAQLHALNQARQHTIDEQDAALNSQNAALADLAQSLAETRHRAEIEAQRADMLEYQIVQTQDSNGKLFAKLAEQGLDLRVRRGDATSAVGVARTTDLIQVEVDLQDSLYRQAVLAKENELLRKQQQQQPSASDHLRLVVDELKLVREDQQRERASLIGHVAASHAENKKLQALLAHQAKRLAKHRADAKLSKFLQRKAVAELASVVAAQKITN